MSGFAFVGHIPASKSIINRLRIVKSYFPSLQIQGTSDAEDVIHLDQALNDLSEGQTELFVGAGGTVLRFLALRVARESGEFLLKGSPRLFARPQDELLKILRQLGAETEVGPDFLKIRSQGWKMHGDTLLVPFARSSQFASAVLINAWNLPFELFVSLGGQKVSEGYWRMTVRLATDLGMKIDFWDGDFRVPTYQRLKVFSMAAEIDLSSAFTIAAVAAVSGTANLTDFPAQTLQPDGEFVRILATMGVPIHLSGNVLKVERALRLNGVAVNLKNSPDLFPVLAVLCALAEGESHLYGAAHLVHKESNRIEKISDLVCALGREVDVLSDGIKIRGSVRAPGEVAAVDIDTDQDHRIAFAAAVAKAAGYPVTIKNGDVVKKSFPQFWSVLGWGPS